VDVCTEMAAPADAERKDLEEVKEEESPGSQDGKSWAVVALCIFGLLASLYVFLLGLQMLGDSFKCLGGRGAGSMFKAVENPIAGLMTGVLATVLVQSSSTSTSIVVGLVGADQITVKTGIPIIMGANIGTSVTNTIVSMGHVGHRLELQRAFAGATVHDMFNYLTVVTLLPIEVIGAAIQGEGGPLYWLTQAITDGIMGKDKGTELFPSPIKAITGPVAELFISNNKYVIKALSLGAPAASMPNATNATLCASGRRLAAPAAGEDRGGAGRALLSRRMASSGGANCSRYFCVSKELDKNFKKISSSGYKTLTGCDGYVLDPSTPCSPGDHCYLDAGAYYQRYVQDNHIIEGGITEGAGDFGGGIISLVIALAFLTGGLFFLTKFLHKLFMGRAKRVVARATRMNDYLALLVGVGLTIVVQSSSVVTSALTPFCGMGLLTLEKMLPLTLGANIGTTVTALIAALAKMTNDTVHIALCHLFFNIVGILIWFPAPFMRRFPLGAARLLGLYASFYRFVPLLYILLAFVAIPSLALGVSALLSASLAGGLVLLLFLLGAFAAFQYWWVWREGCYRVISKEDRGKGQADAERDQRAILEGEEPSPAQGDEPAPAQGDVVTPEQAEARV